MKIKFIIQEEVNKLLLEVTFESVKERFNSKKFLKAFGGESKLASEQLLSVIPSDIEEKYKGVLLNWLISWAIKNNTSDLPTVLRRADFKAAVEIYYQIKQQKLQRFLTKKSISQIETPEELISIVNSAKPEYNKHNDEKLEKSTKGPGQNLIYQDSDWEVYIPETKGASCALGKGTEWCTAKLGLDFYEKHHSKENPLIIFISKSDPEEKYQFHYKTEQFMDPNDDDLLDDDYDTAGYSDELADLLKLSKRFKPKIPGMFAFHKLNDLVKTKLKGKISKKSIKSANGYAFEKLKNGGHRYLDRDEETWFNQDGKRHREDGPAIELANGSKLWYLNGKVHREDGPAVERTDGYKEWQLNGERHREDGPAVEGANGDKAWYLNGKLHREDGPAAEHANGDKAWYLNGKRHREDGPAIEWTEGSKKWFLNGKLHREDGPAIEWADGKKGWYLNGKLHSEEQFNKKVKNRSLKEHFKRFL